MLAGVPCVKTDARVCVDGRTVSDLGTERDVLLRSALDLLLGCHCGGCVVAMSSWGKD